MARRIVVEDACPHERTNECGNPICGECNGAWGHERKCSYAARGSQGTYPCPGGSRRVLDPGSYVLLERQGSIWPKHANDALLHWATTDRVVAPDDLWDALAGGEQP